MADSHDDKVYSPLAMGETFDPKPKPKTLTLADLARDPSLLPSNQLQQKWPKCVVCGGPLDESLEETPCLGPRRI